MLIQISDDLMLNTDWVITVGRLDNGAKVRICYHNN